MFLSNKIKPWVVIFFSLLLHGNFSFAQTKVIPDAAKVETLQLEGKTLESKDFQLSSLKGKVALVTFW
jgi:cytochrome oxidase Cu insertion factor (SCO1/SenC/PrrC family)